MTCRIAGRTLITGVPVTGIDMTCPRCSVTIKTFVTPLSRNIPERCQNCKNEVEIPEEIFAEAVRVASQEAYDAAGIRAAAGGNGCLIPI